MTTAATSAATIERDISCFECHYNIRGLPADTACPECGLPIGNTLLAMVDHEASLNARIEVDPRLLRSVRDGSLLILIGVVLWISLLLAPESWGRFRTPERVFLLGVACSAWTCTCYGFHKLATKASSPILRAADPVMRRLLRLTALTLAIAPAPITIVGDYRHELHVDNRLFCEAIVVISVCAFTLIGPLLFLRIHRLMRQLDMRWNSGLAAFLAAMWSLSGVICYFSINQRYDPFNSLRFLLETPIPPFGCPIFWEELFRLRYSYERLPLVLIALIPTMSLWLTGALCVTTWRRLAAAR